MGSNCCGTSEAETQKISHGLVCISSHEQGYRLWNLEYCSLKSDQTLRIGIRYFSIKIRRSCI